MNEHGKTCFNSLKMVEHRFILKTVFLFLILFISLCCYTISAAPDGYCEETLSDVHLATWITDVDYELLPMRHTPKAIKITVNIFFTTEGFGILGYPCQPDPDSDKDFRYVNAWIDWDGDYSFDSTEQVLNEEFFWYDESYQDWLISTYEGDPFDIMDIILLPRENFKGKSIRWFAYDGFAGGMGIMTITKIISLPDDYVNDTWMRVNYGWLYDPQMPCELFETSLNPPGADPYEYWEYGDATYKQITTTPDLCINSSDIVIKQKSTSTFPYHDFKDSILTVTVHNNGKKNVENVDVLMIKTDEKGTKLSSETKTINSIVAESHVNITFEGNFDPYRFEEIIIELDPENKIWETNESNNIATTHSIEGLIHQHHYITTPLPKTRVDLNQQIGTNFQTVSVTLTDEYGFYKFWTNSKYIKKELPTKINALLEYVPKMQFPGTIFVINETEFGDRVYPRYNVANNKKSTPFTLQKNQDYTYDITFSGVEGGLAYQTLITTHQYHEKLKTAPSWRTYVNINDDDTDGAYVFGAYIHLPSGKMGTTNPFIIGHEFTHIVERGWIPTYYGHNPLVPVEEGSCHWGACVALKNPIAEIPDGSGGFVTLDVSNNNHTSNGPPASDSFIGMREEFQIAGTMWDLNETLGWNTLRHGFRLYLAPWPSTPLLFYSAYKELDSRSSLELKAIFQSHAYNTSGWPGKDGLDPDYFTEIFSDEGIDLDGNGKYDALQVTSELNITNPGTYILTGTIGGTTIGASNTTYLESGIQEVVLSFYGENIYESQKNGAYNISFYLYYDNYTFLDNRISFYDTQPYSYTEFERPTLLFAGNRFIETVDEDGDGTFDQLIVDVELNLTESCYVKMYAGLYCNDVFIDNCWGPSMYDDAVYEYVEAGVNNLSLYFNGESIHASRQNGTYELKTYLSSAKIISLGLFNFTDFDTSSAVLGSIIEEYILDDDGDGFFDSLNINISVSGVGAYAITGHLYNETGAHILTTFHFDDINDTQSLLLSFDGNSLRDQQQREIYNLTVELSDEDGVFIGWKNYVLSFYEFTDFEPSSEDIFNITFTDYGIDTNGHSGYETLRIAMDITSLLPGMYTVEGYLYTDEGVLICFDETIGYIDNTIGSISLDFDGQLLGSLLYNGRYTLDLVFKNSSRIIERKQVYSTAYYSFNSFETSYIYDTTDKLYSYGGSSTIANRLGVNAQIYSTVPRYVTIKARLLDSTGELIAESKTGEIWAYENDSALILFDGSKINDYGVDGPYTIILRLYDELGNLLDTYTSTTNYYDHTVFSLVRLTGSYDDYGLDLDDDLILDYLVIDAEVEVFTDGFCTIAGILDDSTGETITTTESTLWFSEGTQILPLYFNGTMIKNHGINGPYTLKLVSVYHIADVSITDYYLDAYETNSYDYTDFTLSTVMLPNQKPISVATGPKAGSIGDGLLFDASESYDPEGQSLTYYWTFGDGSSSTDVNPTHTYAADGIYTVNLTVNDGTQDSYPKTLIVSIGYPVADTGGPYTVYGIQSLTFNGTASFDPEGQSLTYYWIFGDGGISTDIIPTHTYGTEGVYTVTFTVDDGTYESTATTTVTVLKSLFLDAPTDIGFDIDTDGLYEYLLMDVDVTNYLSQLVYVEVILTDSQGTILSYGNESQYLNNSRYKLSIYFDGATLFENMVNGPYFIELIFRDENNELLDSVQYTTAAHSYTDFQYNTKIGDVIDYGLDIDLNGFYDFLAVNTTIITYIDRDVTIQASLFDANSIVIASNQEASSLTGNTTIQLFFDGKTIHSHEENGPYTVIIELKNEYNQIINIKEHSTFAYQYTDFEEQTNQIWTVDDDDLDVLIPPADFSSIQEAINAAAEGDEILVYAGTYYESLALNKSLTLRGFGLPTINAEWMGHGINITADSCTIQGFFITNAFMGNPDIYTAGIFLVSNNNTIRDNSFESNENGIFLLQAHDNVIENNTITVSSYNSDVHNIIVLHAKRNSIIKNSCLGGGKGITLINCSSTHIYLNTLANSNYNGYDDSTQNRWNSTMPVEYLYNGVGYNGNVGNYWDDHVSTDDDNDGIYDTPYPGIGGSGNAIDYYPMVGNWPPTAEANGAYRADSGDVIQFNSSGSFDPEGQPLSYLWDFNDGNTSTEPNPTHAYSIDERKTFTVELTVSDGVHTDTDIALAIINYPVAIAGGPYYADEGVSITLNGSASYDPLEASLQYYWYPANGGSASWSPSSQKYVTYSSEGVYTPYLKVMTATPPIVYSSNSYATVYVNDTDPIPDFTSNQQNGQAPLTIDFTDLSTSYDGIVLWEWDFDGDGIIDVSGSNNTERNPSFTYFYAGNYSVNLTVHEADGDKVSMIKTDHIIVIGPRPPITIYVPDEYQTIQEAIDSGNTLNKDTIIVRDGVYRQNIIINKSLTIRSENGLDNCQLFPDIPLNNHLIVINSNNVTIDGFYMNGTRSTSGRYGACYSNGFENITISNNWINDSSAGIILDHLHNTLILNNTIVNCSSNSIYGDYIQNISIIDNILSYSSDGMELRHATYCTVHNNIANENRYSGMVLRTSDHNVLSLNTMNGNGVVGSSSYEDCGLRVISGDYNMICNNTMNNNLEYGLFLDDPYTTVCHNIICHNIMQENNLYDLYIKDHNIVHSNTGSGDRPIIYANDTIILKDMVVSQLILMEAEYSLIQNVTVAGSDILTNNGIWTMMCDNLHFDCVNSSYNYYGLLMWDNHQDDTLITNCTFNYNWNSGVLLQGDRNTVENSDLSFNGYKTWGRHSGVETKSQPAFDFDLTISNCTITNNSISGLWIEDASQVQIRSNVIAGNPTGVRISGVYSSECTITGNVIANSLYNGIRTHRNYDTFLIYNNMIVNNSVYDQGSNTWNVTKTPGPNVIGGPYIGGNYWSEYTGLDLDGDFLGDTDIPFNSSGTITTGGDYHPLVYPHELFITPIQNQTMYESDTLFVPIYASGTDPNAIVLNATNLPSFAVFNDEGNGVGIIEFAPIVSDEGDYLITVNATDGIYTVTEFFILSVLPMNHPPVASFLFESETPKTLETIYFNSTSFDPDGTIVNWTWDMDDGTIIYGEHVVHQFSTAATYTVCLTVTDNDEETDAICASVMVLEECYELNITVPAGGLVGKNPDQTCYIFNTNVLLTPVAAQDYTFYGWDGPHADDLINNSDGTWSIVMDDDKMITALFTLDDSLSITLTTNGTGYGTIETNPSGPYMYGDTVTVWANASVGSTFTGFYGSLSGDVSPQSLSIDSNKSVNAEFTLDGPFILNLQTSGNGNGTVEVSPSGPYMYGDTVTVWANASIDSVFNGFSGDVSGNITPKILFMEKNKEVTAHFEKIELPPCQPEIELPDTPITLYAWEFPQNRSTAYEIELTGINGEYDVIDGAYDGWCVDYGTPIPNGYSNPHTIILRSSYDQLPDYLDHENWSKVNYLINHPKGDAYDVQRAIFYFINLGQWDWNYTGYMSKPVSNETWDMIDDANANGSDWCPRYGDIIAVICDPGVDHSFQITFIEALLSIENPEGGDQEPGGNNNPDKSDTSKEVNINKGPIAVATVDVYIGNPGLVCRFDASDSYDPDGDIIFYIWNFDDGTSQSTDQTKIIHSFDGVGIYNVMLTVKDNDGAQGSIDEPITIEILQANNPPKSLSATIDKTRTHKNVSIMFTMSAIDPDPDDLICFVINWGDGDTLISDSFESGKEFEAFHQWETSGVYKVDVTAFDKANASTKTQTITIYVDVIVVDDLITGWLIDDDSDGIYDSFLETETGIRTKVQQRNETSYLIDTGNDGNRYFLFDVYESSVSVELEENPEESKGTISFLLISGFIFLLIVLILIGLVIHQTQKNRRIKKY